MPKGPQGQWRPADPVACAVHIGQIATGEIQETFEAPRLRDPVEDSRRASEGGKARAASQGSGGRGTMANTVGDVMASTPTVEERLAAIETELRYVATKKDVETLKVWVLSGSGTMIVGVVIAAVTWLVRLLGD